MSKLLKLAALLLVCAMMLQVTACGVGEKTGSQGTGDKTTQKVEAKEMTLEVWSFFSPGTEQAKIYEGFVSEFTKENPNVKIDLQFVGQDIVTKLRPRFQQKDPPDLFLLNSQTIELFAKEGLLKDLTEELNGKDYSGNETWRDTFIKGTLDTTIVDGKNYSIPEQLVITAWFYNKDLFEEYNLQTPKNWNDFIKICDTLKENGIDPIAQDGNVDMYLSWFFSNIAIRVAGYEKWMDTLARKEGTSWNDPDFIAAATKLQQILPYFQKGFEGTQYPAANALFVQGKAAMMYVGSWLPQEVSSIKPEGFQMGMFEFPVIEDGKETRKLVEAKTNGYAVPIDGKNPEGAVELLKFISRKSSAEMIAKLDMHPAVKGVAPPEILKDVQGIIEAADVVTQQYSYLHSAEYLDWSTATIYPLNAKFMFGDIATPEEYMKQLEEKTVEYYKNK
jgi:raffinose/stachyose/melibiose transport system substrate-binding protein